MQLQKSRIKLIIKISWKIAFGDDWSEKKEDE